MCERCRELQAQLAASQAQVLMVKPLAMRYIRLANEFYERMVAWMSESTEENKAAWEVKGRQLEEAEKALQATLATTPAQAGERMRALERVANSLRAYHQPIPAEDWHGWDPEKERIMALHKEMRDSLEALAALEKGEASGRTPT